MKICIESILNQIFTYFELILVNYGSTDSLFKICRSYELIDNIVVIIDKSNGDVLSVKSTGLDIAT